MGQTEMEQSEKTCINRRRSDMHPSCHERIKKQVKRRFPIFAWLPTYKKSDLTADIIAGVTVGLTVVPQSLSYAIIAGLNPKFGLYSSYFGCFLYAIIGSCKQVTIGPTAVMGLLTYETCGSDFPSCAILTGFYSGVFELLMALLQLGWVVSFISESVVVGFTAGAATTIISSQIKSFIGLSGAKGSGFTGYWYAIFRDISTINVGDCCMGVTSFIILFLLRKLKDYKHPTSPKKKLIDTACWLISVSRNVIIVVITSVIAYFWTNPPFKLIGHVEGGFPSVGVPSFTLPINSSDPTSEKMTYWETWSFIGAGPLVVALIAVLQNVAISKAFGSGQTIDATQEMFALGSANVIGSFLSSIPISGSFSRSAVNEASGVRSPMGGLFTGILVLLSLGFLTPSFYYIPRASLGAVIISAVMFMIEYEAVPVMWRVNRMDAVFCIVTYICSIMVGMEYGIMTGVGLSFSVILIKMLRPQLNPDVFVEDTVNMKYIIANPDSGLNFPSVDYIRTCITKLLRKHADVSAVVINFDKWQTFDYTVVTAIISLAKLFKKENKVLVFMNISADWEDALKAAGLQDILTCHERNLKECIRQISILKTKCTELVAIDVHSHNASKSLSCENKRQSCGLNLASNNDSISSSEVVKPLL